MDRIIYLLYTADAWLSRDSMNLEGAFSMKKNLRTGTGKLLRAMLEEKTISPEPDESRRQFIKRVLAEFTDNSFQTQSLKVNLIAESITLNKLE